MRHFVWLGIILGLGLLTKATFLPVAVAILVVLAMQAWLARKTTDELLRRIKCLCVAVAVMLGVCAWWYLYKLIETGSLIGSSDVIRMQATGGMIAGLMNNLQVEDLVRMPWTFAVTFLWSGTWSFIVPRQIFLLPLVALALMIGYGAFRWIRRHGAQPVDWFAMLAAGLFLGALIYHSAVALSTASGTAPAWYLHSLAPIFALLLGYGIFAAMRVAWLRGLLTALMLYPLLFLPAMSATSALYFAGCAPKLPGRLYFAWSSATACMADLPRMYDNLSVLALPGPAIGFFVAGWIIAAIAMTGAVRYLRAEAAQTSITSTR